MSNGLSLKDVIEQEEKLKIQKALALESDMKSNDVEKIWKAQNYLKTIQPREEEPHKSILVDPTQLQSSFGYKDKPFNLSYATLRAMGSIHIPLAIRRTRKTQVLAFCTPQENKYTTGFIVDKRNRWRAGERDKKMTKEEQKKADYITEFILNCGNTENFWNADTFDTFIGKILDDSMTFDQGTFEVVRDNFGRPCEFFATDGGTFRIADSYMNEEKIKSELINGYPPSYVQVYQGQVYNEFYPWDLGWCVRNPSTDIRLNGYGRSELEDLTQTMTSILNADQYNANFFKVGSSPKGIITYSGNVNQNTIDDFRKNWMMQVAGVMNAHKIPIINGDKINFIPTQQNNREMEYYKYLEFLIKIACGIYIIDPSEINFDISGTANGQKPGFEGNNASRLKYSKDKGLKPLLKYIQGWLNKYIVWQIDPGFELRFVGIDQDEDASTELDMDIKKMGNFMTINEIRAKHNLSPVEGGDIIANPVYMQGKQMAMQGNPDSNDAVDDMQDDEQEKSEDENPFLKAMQNDISKILCAP